MCTHDQFVEVSFDSKQAATYLNCTPRTLYNLRRSGEIKAYALDKHRKRKTWRYLKRELDRYRESD